MPTTTGASGRGVSSRIGGVRDRDRALAAQNRDRVLDPVQAGGLRVGELDGERPLDLDHDLQLLQRVAQQIVVEVRVRLDLVRVDLGDGRHDLPQPVGRARYQLHSFSFTEGLHWAGRRPRVETTWYERAANRGSRLSSRKALSSSTVKPAARSSGSSWRELIAWRPALAVPPTQLSARVMVSITVSPFSAISACTFCAHMRSAPRLCRTDRIPSITCWKSLAAESLGVVITRRGALQSNSSSSSQPPGASA